MDGLAVGIEKGQGNPFAAMAGVGQGLTDAAGSAVASAGNPFAALATAGKGMAKAGVLAAGMGAVALPAVADLPAIDNRPPLAVRAPAGAAGGDTYNVSVTVQVQGGGDPNAIAAAVRREFESIQREAAARRRSSFHDLE